MSTRSEASIDDLKLLAIGDVHLGTRPGSLPEDLAGVDPGTLGPEAALSLAVDCAIAAGVDAVLFAGDVVESTNARFEALRPLEDAVRRLLAAEIPVLAVAGNHDVEALPRLAKAIDGFELLGQGGRWQMRRIERPGGQAVEILGWSFPERQVRASPVSSLLRNPIPPSPSTAPRIGLLHGDLDASGGSYAPITSGELREAGLDAWLLGHIHKPSLGDTASRDDAGPCGYLGSLVGLDPSETGAHGPWLIRVSGTGRVEARQRVIAPLRWERLPISVGLDEGPEDIGDRLLDEAVRLANEIQAAGHAPRVLGLRPYLVGPTRHYGALRRSIEDRVWNGISRSAGATVVFIDKVQESLELAHDLGALARGNDPPALLARKLLLLAGSGIERDSLIEGARQELGELVRDGRWSPLDNERNTVRDWEDPLSDASIAAHLTRAGTTALNALLSARDADAGKAS
jgi:exonuclease SbcD